MLRLTGNERSLAEVAAVAEHIAGMTAAASAFGLQPDIPARPDHVAPPVVALLDEDGAPGAAQTLADIRAWARQWLDADKVPNIWRALAHHPRLLGATWHKHRVVLGPGALDGLAKGCAALAVAQFRQNPYWIAYLTRLLRVSCGLDDRALVEVTAMMMHSLAFNTVAHGMRLEAPLDDLCPADLEPGGRLAQARDPGSPAPAPEAPASDTGRHAS